MDLGTPPARASRLSGDLPAVAWRAVVCGQCGVSIAEFRDNDAAFLAWLSAHGDGYVINIGRGGHGYARLHRADCGTISRRPPLTGPYIKICSVSLAELGHWSAQRPGATLSSCGTCHPQADAQAGHAPAAVSGLAAGAVAARHASAAPGTAAGGGDWEIDGLGPLGEVWLWADRYVAFDQLTPAMRDARAALRSAVRSLAAGAGEILDASYAGHKPANTDVENLVLYNIDAAAGGCFAPAARHGVRFELAARPRRDPPSGRARACSYRYRLVSPASEFSYWRPTRRLARFTSARLGAFPASKRLEQAWLAIHRAEAETAGTGAGAGRPFALFLTLDCPRGTTVAAAPGTGQGTDRRHRRGVPGLKRNRPRSPRRRQGRGRHRRAARPDHPAPGRQHARRARRNRSPGVPARRRSAVEPGRPSVRSRAAADYPGCRQHLDAIGRHPRGRAARLTSALPQTGQGASAGPAVGDPRCGRSPDSETAHRRMDPTKQTMASTPAT